MTLEPIHIKEIHDLVSRIDSCLKKEDESDDKDPVSDIFERLRELHYDGKTVIRALGKLKRGKVSIERILSSADPFSITYACDSGSTTAKTFDNGLYFDLCHCAMTSTPSDLLTHSKRTIVAATYTPSKKVTIRASSDWEYFDSGAGRKKIMHIQSGTLQKKVKDMVHDIALYMCESEHMLWMQEQISSNGFLMMDGPIYPKRLMYWMVVPSEEIMIRTDPHCIKIMQNYIDIMDHHLEKGKPLVGFVKNPEDMQIMHTLKKQDKRLDLPWLYDAQFFKNALDPKIGGIKTTDARRYITYTNWFMQPNQFYEKMLNLTSPLVGERIKHRFPAEDYSLAFFMVLVPSMNTIFKIESPFGLVKDEEMRNKITRKVLYDIALSGIPKTLAKADSLAKIQVAERRLIVGRFINSRLDTSYNDIRWGETDER